MTRLIRGGLYVGHFLARRELAVQLGQVFRYALVQPRGLFSRIVRGIRRVSTGIQYRIRRAEIPASFFRLVKSD